MRRFLWTLAVCGSLFALVACNSPEKQTTTNGNQLLVTTPNHARQGDTITLNGLNWQPNSPVTLAFDITGQQDGVATSLGNTTADAQGHFTFVSIVPQAAAPGTWSITARGTGNQSAQATFTVLEGGDTSIAAPQTLAATDTPLTSDTAQPTGTPIAPTNTRTPPTRTPARRTPGAPTSTPQPVVDQTSQPDASFKAIWRDNKLELSGDGWPANEQIKVSASKSKDGSGALMLGMLGTNGRGQFDVSAKVPKEVHDNWYIILQDATHQVIVRITTGGGD